MQVTLTNEQMRKSMEVLATVEETGFLGYALAKNCRKISDEIREYVATYDRMLAQYGESLGDGRFRLSGEGAKSFKESLGELPDDKSVLDLVCVKPEVFYGGKLTTRQMMVLDWMVEND